MEEIQNNTLKKSLPESKKGVVFGFLKFLITALSLLSLFLLIMLLHFATFFVVISLPTFTMALFYNQVPIFYMVIYLSIVGIYAVIVWYVVKRIGIKSFLEIVVEPVSIFSYTAGNPKGKLFKSFIAVCVFLFCIDVVMLLVKVFIRLGTK